MESRRTPLQLWFFAIKAMAEQGGKAAASIAREAKCSVPDRAQAGGRAGRDGGFVRRPRRGLVPGASPADRRREGGCRAVRGRGQGAGAVQASLAPAAGRQAASGGRRARRNAGGRVGLLRAHGADRPDRRHSLHRGRGARHRDGEAAAGGAEAGCRVRPGRRRPRPAGSGAALAHPLIGRERSGGGAAGDAVRPHQRSLARGDQAAGGCAGRGAAFAAAAVQHPARAAAPAIRAAGSETPDPARADRQRRSRTAPDLRPDPDTPPSRRYDRPGRARRRRRPDPADGRRGQGILVLDLGPGQDLLGDGALPVHRADLARRRQRIRQPARAGRRGAS